LTDPFSSLVEEQPPRPKPTAALLMLTGGLWLAQFVSLIGRSIAASQYNHFWYGSIVRFSECVLGAALCLVMAWVVGRLGGGGRRLGAKVLLAIALSLAASVAWSAIEPLVVSVEGSLAHVRPYRAQTLNDLYVNTIEMSWLFFTWSGVWLAIIYDTELSESKLLAAKAQNQMLRYQLNPHFMFNTLSALATFISQRDAQKAERVVLSLARFLRASLERAPREKAPVREEIAVQEEYLAIEAARFDERLRVSIEIEAEAENCLVPSLILQPLVENAIKYGVAGSLDPVTLEIRVSRVGDRLQICVRDDGGGGAPALDTPALGVGLANVRRHLALLYHNKASLTVGPLPQGGWESIIRMPIE